MQAGFVRLLLLLKKRWHHPQGKGQQKENAQLQNTYGSTWEQSRAVPHGLARLCLRPARSRRMEPAGHGAAMAAALRAAKRQLRGELRQRLRAIGAAEKQRQSRLLGRKVIDHPKYQECKRIAIFLSMPDEVQTEEIIKDIFKQGKECFIPRYKPQSNHMDMLKLSSAEDISSLALTSWNILQPSDDDNAREEALAGGGLDLIFMPGLGFDKKGNRLGRGKGYYDTYLERCMKHPRGKPYTIALAFKEQICESVPVTENDVPVDEILYEDC